MLQTSKKINLNSLVLNKLNVAYIVIDRDLQVIEYSSNLQQYGYGGLHQGKDVTDCIDFLVGVQADQPLDLPVVMSPSDKPVSISLVPSNDNLMVLIMDAANDYVQQQGLQQKANEVQLLSDQQTVLMQQLQETKKQLQESNEQLSEAVRLQSSFLSGVSHEFRTPLSAIIGYANLLVDSNAVEADLVGNYSQAISRSSRHLLSLVENLLDHGRLKSEELVINPKPVKLVEVVADVLLLLNPLAQTKYLKFEIRQNFSDDIVVSVDESRLRQCLINIIANAIKFTDQGNVTVDISCSDDFIEVVVDDTGQGIEKEQLAKVMTPFYQAPDTGKSGTGLGLSITQQLIELMGGKLTIDSVFGKGTKVQMSVLAPIMTQVVSVSSVTDSLAIDADKRILLAEDDQDIADLVCLLLQQHGVSVSHVLNGALAVEKVAEETFDLILMDVHMPVLTGYQAVGAIRQSGVTTPIVIMTASAIEADKAKAQALGCDAYLVKPVDVQDILQIASELAP